MEIASTLVAVVVGFGLGLLPRVVDALASLARHRHRQLDEDYVRMRTALVTLQYWLTEQAKREDSIPPRQFIVWRDYVDAILNGPPAPFAPLPAQKAQHAERASGAAQ